MYMQPVMRDENISSSRRARLFSLIKQRVEGLGGLHYCMLKASGVRGRSELDSVLPRDHLITQREHRHLYPWTDCSTKMPAAASIAFENNQSTEAHVLARWHGRSPGSSGLDVRVMSVCV